jgi:hypothetical protein
VFEESATFDSVEKSSAGSGSGEGSTTNNSARRDCHRASRFEQEFFAGAQRKSCVPVVTGANLVVGVILAARE